MTDIELQNGCVDKKLSDWSERAWAHYCVGSTAMIKNNESLKTWCEDSAMFGKFETPSTEALFVGFETGDQSYTAILISNIDLVILFSRYKSLAGNDEESVDYTGEFTHENFWAFLETIPNPFKYMSHNPSNRSGYWNKVNK